MKIACLIRPHSPIIYFLNKISEIHNISFVICESNSKHVNNKYTINNILNYLKRILINDDRYYDNLYDKYFGNKWREIDKALKFIECNSINSNELTL